MVFLIILVLFVILIIGIFWRSYKEYFEEVENDWDKIPEKLKNISISGRNVCGVTEDDRIRCSINGRKWEEKEGRLKYLSLSGNKICGVNGINDIYCANDANKPVWKHIQGKLKQIDLSGNKMCGTGYVDDIYCADFMKNNWTRLDGSLKQLSIDGKRLCGVNGKNDIYCTDSLVKVGWKHIPGKLTQIDIGDNKMCGVGLNNEIYCADYAKDNWVRKTGNVKFISIDTNQSYSITPNNDVLYTFDLESMNYVEPPVYKNPEPLKIYDILTSSIQEGIKKNDNKVCVPVADTLQGEEQKYDIIKNYLLVKDPKDINQCYIKDSSLVFDGECSLKNRGLYEPRKDKNIVEKIFKQTITDDYVSDNIPQNVCTIKFKNGIPQSQMKSYLAKLDANMPKIKQVGVDLEEARNYSNVLVDEKSVKEDDLQRAENTLNQKRKELENQKIELQKQTERINDNRHKYANLDGEINQLKKSMRFL
jgi:predicted RNA-binding protein